jgi:hypothetical protein
LTDVWGSRDNCDQVHRFNQGFQKQNGLASRINPESATWKALKISLPGVFFRK